MRRLPGMIIALTLLLGSAGCGSGVRYYRARDLVAHRPLRVAVLPLTNQSATEGAGDALRLAIGQEMLRRGDYRPVRDEQVNPLLAEMRIRYADRMSAEQAQELARRLGADALLVGVLETYEYREMDGEKVPLVSLHLRMIEPESGRVLWAADHHRAGNDHEFLLGLGLERSLARLGQKVVHEMVATLPQPGGGS